jgi:tetratricopeptide (TPR) repeat protein
MVATWRVVLLGARWLGRVGRLLFVDARAVTLLVLLAPAAVCALRDEWDTAAAFAGAWLTLVLLLAALAARNRLIIGEFNDLSRGEPDIQSGAAAPGVELANLLIVEIARLGDLFQVVGDRRAVSSGLTHQRGIDATLSVDDLVENLRGTITTDTKTTFGPVSIPLAPFVTLFTKLLQSPRLTGTLHCDSGTLILTAQLSGNGGLSWRVHPPVPAPDETPATAIVSAMVEELALRMYTDLALGRSVRWEASQAFVSGLRCFRACLRTPKDRKVNLKLAEELFLKALAEDEDFPLAYYNLGVAYTELHGLAVAAGRKAEAETRLSAAETSFGRAIEKDPARWECYFAFAQTQFRYRRYDSVVELCSHILQLKPEWAHEAKARELLGRALMERDRREDSGESRAAIDHAMQASRLALRSLALARLACKRTPRAEHDPESRAAELATGCLLTFSDIYSRYMPVAADSVSKRFGGHNRIRRRLRWLVKLAPLTHGKAELQFDFGRRALKDGNLRIAEEELAAAVRSDPTRPSYSAGLALARATMLSAPGQQMSRRQRREITGLCLRALQGMAGAFFPSRDARACRMVADVYDKLGSEADRQTAERLRDVADEVDRRLSSSVGGASVSGIFLEVLQSSDDSLSMKIGAYGKAAQQGRARLLRGQRFSTDGEASAALLEFRKALQDAERATSLNPLSTLAWETLGDVHRELSDFQSSRAAWEQALGTDPDNPRLYDKIGSSYWHIAFEGRTRARREDLVKAAEYFNKALRLYGSGRFDEQVLTHYRLGKLNAVLRDFEDARRHLEIVAAVGRPPVVGWVLLGFAYLEQRNFPECEYFFLRVVRAGERFADEPATTVVGDRLDEQHWPIALIRAWGHLGLAITFAERDGDLAKARRHVDDAAGLLDDLELDPYDPSSDERFPTRAVAAVVECRGLILLRAGEVDAAVRTLDDAVSRFPHSRAYVELALALEQQALGDVASRTDVVPRARRLLDHAVSLAQTDEPSPAIAQALDRLGRLGNGDGSAPG